MKNRPLGKETWLYGINPVLEALRAGRRISALYISSGRKERAEELTKEAERRRIPVRAEDASFFDSRFPKGHQGVAARVSEKPHLSIEELLEIPGLKGEAPFFVLLDGVEDPRNFGAIARSAEAAGVHGIVVESRRSALSGPVVFKSSAGALEHLPVSVLPNIKHAIRMMKEAGILIAGLEAGDGLEPWTADLSVPVALVLGSEGKGLRKTVREKCDFLISLPLKGKVNSLNVSVAAGVAFFEILRQRSRK